MPFCNRKIKAGLIGCGTIGRFLAEKIKELPSFSLCGVFDKKMDVALSLSRELGVRVYEEGEELLKEVDFLIEAASAEAAIKYGKMALRMGKALLVMSVAALILDEEMIKIAKETGAKLFIPSGAIAGVDALKAARAGNIKEVMLTSLKSSHSLRNYIEEKGLSMEKECIVFEGSAKEAVEKFPGILNIAATISLATQGANLKIRIIAVPDLKENIHRLKIEGDFGIINIECRNRPCPQNPKTSFIALLSAKTLLEEIEKNIKIGT